MTPVTVHSVGEKPVLIAGEINVDLVFGGCSAMPQAGTEVLAREFQQVPGSSSMICAMGLARLGEPVAFVGWAGDDVHGTYCIDALRRAGVDTAAVRVDAQQVTGVTVALSTSSDRALVTCPGSIGALHAEDVNDALLARARHLHVSSFYLQQALRPQLGGLFARAHAAGLTTSLDPGFDPAQKWADAWPELLRHVDVFLPNALEACAISGTDGVESALLALANGVTRSVIKCGAEGAMTLDGDGNVLHVPGWSQAQMRDSTGAGDSFNAGFLHSWLAGFELREALRWGNACGSLSTRGIGGTASQSGVDEVQALLEAGA